MTANRGEVFAFSHLRWDFVYQRPQHLLSRCARDHRVTYVEEPVFGAASPVLELRTTDEGVTIAVPHLPHGLTQRAAEIAQRMLVDQLIERSDSGPPVLWYYTPMALAFTQHLRARAVVYDCMDELSLFDGAPAELGPREALLLRRADVVFTGGASLYEHKRASSPHRNLHAFPSSVDQAHFAQARLTTAEPADQAALAHPRVGFFGVIDERMDLGLLDGLAQLRPDLQLVMLGPTAKIDPATLPQRPNLHWLGSKRYAELPTYLAGWDVAMMPFARNASTRFISPTKTPEYLAAGCPVVSTSIKDVVTPYGDRGLAQIADSPAAFAAAIDAALASDPTERRARADAFLADMSWDHTWREMWHLVERAAEGRALRASGLQVVPSAVANAAASATAAVGAASAAGEE